MEMKKIDIYSYYDTNIQNTFIHRYRFIFYLENIPTRNMND